MSASNINSLGFELAYLSQLTKAGLKPLSRWEKEFNRETELLLQDQGLKTRVVHRSVVSGKHLKELLFGTSDQALDLYAKRFGGTAICPSPTNLRIQGRLFGYPSCCVESFAAQGYARNHLRPSDQRILFHWACPRCTITPLLLPHYRNVFRRCRHAMRGRTFSTLPVPRPGPWSAHVKQAMAVAASLIAIGLCSTPGHAVPAPVEPDSHWLPLPSWDDPDLDLLASWEEEILDNNPTHPDQNSNGQPDGADLARALSAALDTLPATLSPEVPYVRHHMAFGLETCDICGAITNMGLMEIVHPLENQTISFPYIAKHFLEHGSFNYAGSIHSGRINAPLLHLLLTKEGLGHFLTEPPGTDTDNDGLRDWEEPAFKTDPANPDSDGDLLRDGIDLARELRAQLDGLPRFGRLEDGPQDRPFIVEHPMDGIETCPQCGVSVVMDVWEVINPVSGAVIAVPSMALHYLDHGGCTWQGGQLLGGAGRVDPRQLHAVLTGQGDGHHIHVTPDADSDLLTDREEIDLHSNPENPDENGNQLLDGPELAQTLAADIAGLPSWPEPNAVYKMPFDLRGLERCDICGQNVNMGHFTICNPMAGLYSKIPYIALHYLEHGSFSFAGNVHGQGRNDVLLLVDTLQPTGPSHLRPVPDDTDGDGLTDPEERCLGTDPFLADTDYDCVPDGFQTAHGLWQAVEALPRTPGPSSYVIEHPLRGLVSCDFCGAQVNMGHLEVVNPREQLTVSLPYLALHALRHGSFTYTLQDRVQPRLLDIAVRGDGTSHLVEWPDDSDHDGLLDSEELHFGTQPDQPDTNGDGTLDGVALARKLHRHILRLPSLPLPGKTYVTRFEANCFAPCPICLETCNCGFLRVTNSWAELSMDIPFMNLHFMQHGSFASPSSERSDPIRLEAILRPAVRITAEQGEVTLRWLAKGGRTYQVFSAPDLSGPWTPGPTYPGNDNHIVFTEQSPPETQRRFYKVVAW